MPTQDATATAAGPATEQVIRIADQSSRVVEGSRSTAELALVLSGGGARAAYQVGLLVWLAKRFPELRIPILTGVSAGAVNAAHIASHHGTFAQAVTELSGLWRELVPHKIFRMEARSLAWSVLRWGFRLVSGGAVTGPDVRGLVDTSPLRELLEEVLAAVNGEVTGIDYNLQRGVLRALALSTTSYTTGQNVIWVQGRGIETWNHPQRRSVETTMTVDHVMASSALPLFFPAVPIGEHWFGDGGVRMAAPLSPALHLGASRILTISTRYDRSQREADLPTIAGYPPPAQVLGFLMNAIFLDVIDQDVRRLERLNRLLERLPEEHRNGQRIVHLLVLRPSKDLGRITAEYEARLPGAFRFLTRGLGTRQTASPDLLSMIMFQQDYIGRLIELGEADAEARGDEIAAFVEG